MVGMMISAAAGLGHDLGFLIHERLGGIDLKGIFLQVASSKLGLWGMRDCQIGADDCPIGKDKAPGNGVNRGKDFRAVFEEVARAKREGNVK